jgi:protoheme IX farnesyltransferase
MQPNALQPGALQPNTLAARRPLEAQQLAKGLYELCKPRITRMVMVTAWLGAVIAPGPVHWGSLIITLIGTSLIVAGANALNMALEADADALMKRTRERPVPSGRISAELAIAFSVGVAVLGYAVLARWGNPVSSVLAVGAFLAYAFVYTPAKRHSPYALHIGAVPGAIPPLIGWASSQGSISFSSLSLFLILFIWQLPHFMAITLFRAAEYERAGFLVYPTVKGVPATERAMVHWSALLALATLLPWWAGLVGSGLAGFAYGAVALLLGVSSFLLVALGRRWLEAERYARAVFIASIPYLVVSLGALALCSQ